MKYNKFYDAATPTDGGGGYGYQDDEVKQSPFNFGLNAGAARLTKFEYIPNGGKDGAEQDALEIIFNINGTEKSYRKFPIVKAFGKNNEEITDPNAPEFKEALADLNAVITHILHVFVDSDVIKATFQRRIANFKEFAQIAASILPKDFANHPLDIFMQYQWNISEGKEKTYLDIPGKMKYGRWLQKAVAPQNSSSWKEMREPNPSESTRKALWYVDGAGNEHPFVKNGWFMLSNFANQQRTGGTGGYTGNSNAGAAMNSGTTATPAASTGTPGGIASAW